VGCYEIFKRAERRENKCVTEKSMMNEYKLKVENNLNVRAIVGIKN